MTQGGARNTRADFARDYVITHAEGAATEGWQCDRCGSLNVLSADFCAQCGADGQSAQKIAYTPPDVDDCPVLIVTTNEISGYRITAVHGDVFGLVVRARDYFSNLGARFMTLAGGEVSAYTRLLTDSRNDARQRMWREARVRGANAVVGMRFDCNEIGGIMSEIAAYGTAVTVEPADGSTTAT